MRKLNTSFKNTLSIYKRRKKFIASLILFLSVVFPLYISLRDIAIESIPFWYDPARDLLIAWDNLSKFTLIGPPSGIPGIFYGPQWIWFLSFGLIFSKDPRIVTALVLALPYFTVFPLLYFRFAKLFGKRIIVLLWLLFILGYKTYTTQIWNLHLATFFLLIIVYILVFTDFKIKEYKTYFRILLAGFFAGLLINVHISFGVIILLSYLVFFVFEFILFTPKYKWKDNLGKEITALSLFTLGLVLSFAPNLAFEIRHGFNQTQALIEMIDKSLHNSAVVGYLGLSRNDILSNFFGITGKLLNLPQNIINLLYLVILCHFIFRLKTYLTGFNRLAQKLVLFLIISNLCILIIFLTSKNPVWAYHFIGSEILILFFFGLILTKFNLLKNLLTIWVILLVFYNIYLLTLPSEIPQYKVSNLATKKYIVDTIYKDTQKESFAVFAFSSAIYTYDYDYLFRWYGTDKYPNQIPEDAAQVKNVYLIIPKVDDPIKLDFINYKTSSKEYKTMQEWKIPDGTTIIKRERVNTPD